MDNAPDSSPAKPVISSGPRRAWAAATPTSRPLVEIKPSFAPSTAARSQLLRPLRCGS
jgi:hypothetical protein